MLLKSISSSLLSFIFFIMTKLTVGDQAPEFVLPDQEGKDHELADYRGQWVLLYFYPKDDTPGCTKEACGIRDRFFQFKKYNAVVLGVSVDTSESHEKFRKKYKLPFTLLGDTEKTVVEKYGVWGEKIKNGKSSQGIRRTSFLIDPDGNIGKIYEAVKPESHAQEVLEDLGSLA